VGDVLLGDYKIAGSAQRRYRGTVLQHGSILLSRSPAAPELPGIAELSSVKLSAEELAGRWLPKITEALGLVCRVADMKPSEIARAQELFGGRYGSKEWTVLK
jgi:lipoate-protein ligase A